jgi:hypothetical protein
MGGADIHGAGQNNAKTLSRREEGSVGKEKSDILKLMHFSERTISVE